MATNYADPVDQWTPPPQGASGDGGAESGLYSMFASTGLPVEAGRPAGRPVGGYPLVTDHMAYLLGYKHEDIVRSSGASVSVTGPRTRSSGTSNMQKHEEDTVCSSGLPVTVTGPRPRGSSMSSTRPVLPGPAMY